ncbi:hypothetical protein [Nocardiopsis sp. CNT312]|uniref:hypothetical protein n=1 Tax=Nocardiopsis sp. CNT312 TaxID=1137268 RepID=UPI0004AEEFF1|nr:hypothetical protein [Nocardiopsis sp. CNT312]
MQYLTALFAVLSRLIRPSRGLHAAPRILRRERREEARARRASRVRRYAVDVPTVARAADVPSVPSPRRALDDALRITDSPQTVPGFYRRFEERRGPVRASRGHHGPDLLMGLGVPA